MTSHPKLSNRSSRLVNNQERRERRYPVLTRIDSTVGTMILLALVLGVGAITYQVVKMPENFENLRLMVRQVGIKI